MPITGPPLLNSAINAVGIPARPLDILKPSCLSDSAKRSALLFS
tara:strand:- start:964 stop:1095 length:132 start_codon:yes stop_codon:yes gene_type:complete